MKILMVAPEPIFEPRGTPFSVIYRIKALTELGHTVDLLTYHIGMDIDMDNLNIYRIPKIPFIRKIKVGPSFLKVFLDVFLCFKTLLFLIRRRYDAIHSHEEAAFWCVFFARLFRLPHVYDMHSSLPQQLHNFGFFNCFPFRQIFYFFENFVIRNSRSVITICYDLYDTVREIKKDVFAVNIENIFDNSIIFPDDPSVLELHRERFKNKKILLYYGTMEKYQGIDLLMESMNIAMDQNSELFLLIIGGRNDQISLYKSMVKYSERALFLKPLSPGQLKPFIDMADILITTRIRGTNTPLKLYGYIRAGKPIIATNIYSHTQVLSDDLAVLCDPEPESISKAVLGLIADKALAERLSKNCHNHAGENYSSQIYIENVRKAYSFQK